MVSYSYMKKIVNVKRRVVLFNAIYFRSKRVVTMNALQGCGFAHSVFRLVMVTLVGSSPSRRKLEVKGVDGVVVVVVVKARREQIIYLKRCDLH